MRGLRSKAAIVTGGGSGIGRAACLRLGEEGCAVAVLDVNGHAADATAEAVQAVGARSHAYAVDITDYAAVAEAVARFEAEVAPTAILVNNAGWDRIKPFLDTEPDFWERVVGINLHGPLNLHHIVVRGMVERGHGRVVNVASDAGRVGSSGEAVYSACKGGLIAFTKTLAREVARRGVTLNVVSPGPTDTPLLADIVAESGMGARIIERMQDAVPMKRLATPDEVAAAIAFLASDDAAFVTGQVLSVSGGLTMHG